MNLPFVTVIMPICNEAATIERSLGAIRTQNYPCKKMQILIAVAESTDETLKIIERIKKSDNRISILENPGYIVSTGINLALKQARGDFIIRIDGHTIIAPDYIGSCVAEWQRTKAENVGGRMNALGQNGFGQVVAVATSSVFGVGDARFHYSDKEEYVDSVYMGAWPRSIFSKLGGFDEELVRNQDDEFNYRICETKGKILLSPSITSLYFVRSSPMSLWKQYFQYGFWKVRVLQKHPRMMRLRHFVPALFIFSIILSSILSTVTKNYDLLTILLLIYLIINLIFSILQGIKICITYPILLPLVFAILHVSYGTGFLTGCVRFSARWDDRSGKVPKFNV